MTTTAGSTQKGNYVQANGVNIYYKEYGSGEPLLLLHGGTQDHASWEEYLPGLIDHFRVIAPDSRGHGKTKNPAGTLHYSMMAEDMVALIQALGLEKPLICGFSDGGQICLELAIHHPGLAKRYIAYGALHKTTDGYWQTMKELGLESPGVVNHEHFKQNYAGWVEYLEQIHDSWQEHMTQISHLWLTIPEYTDTELASITEPMLIVSGDRDHFNPVEQTVHMYRTIPQAELAIAPGTGHGIPAEIFIPLINGFLLRQSDKGQED